MKHDRISTEFSDVVYPALKNDLDRIEGICGEIEHTTTNSIRMFLMSGVTVIALIIVSLFTGLEIIANVSINVGTAFVIACGLISVYMYGRFTLIRPLYEWIQMRRMVEGKDEEEKHD